MKKICNKCGAIKNKNHVCNTHKQINSKRKTYKQDEVLWTYKWKQKRKYILERDKYFCQRCFYKYKKLNTKNLQIHHIIPRSYDVSLAFDDDNLITLCQECNLEIGTSHQLDFEWENNIYK